MLLSGCAGFQQFCCCLLVCHTDCNIVSCFSMKERRVMAAITCGNIAGPQLVYPTLDPHQCTTMRGNCPHGYQTRSPNQQSSRWGDSVPVKSLDFKKIDTYRCLVRSSALIGQGKDWIAQYENNVTAWDIGSFCQWPGLSVEQHYKLKTCHECTLVSSQYV